MKVLISGISGYIGSGIAARLLGEGYDVAGFDIREMYDDGLGGGPRPEFFKTDIADARTFPDRLKEADVLVHCAALVHNRSSDLSRENYFRINCQGTRNILDFLDANRLKRIIFLSTVSVYGNQAGNMTPDEDTPTAPSDFYGESKLAAEDSIKEFSRKHGKPYTVFRLTPVYGESFLLNINKRIYMPKRLAFYRIGSGEQRLSLASVKNVVDSVLGAIDNSLFSDQTFIVKDAEDYTINEIITLFRTMSNRLPVIRVPSSLSFGAIQLLKLVMPGRGEFYEYQLRKVARDSTYSARKLFSTGVPLTWNLGNTFLRDS